ncbi:MAG: nucleoside monophosphate kinase [Candidatus Sungbacteria bacterium]|nr:nucleoside monophosphate kinase [Candidatus Sungbacteria bacterium]
MPSPLQNKLTLCFLGRSGCGKGTQAKFVLQRLAEQGVFHMETGRFLRDFMTRNNVTTELARTRVMERGELFPWWFPIFVWMRELMEHGHADKHLVGDGTPRRLAEAKLVDEIMTWHGRPLSICVYIDVSEEEATKRLLSRGRADDNLSAIRNRMAYFPRDVLPVVRYYQRHHRLIHVNGVTTPEEVWGNIDRVLARRLGALWPRNAT